MDSTTLDLGTAFLLGLFGSLHCAGMCGPLALALPVPPSGAVGYLAGRCLYQLGRLTTYVLMGLVFGLLGRTLLLAGVQRWLSIALGVALLAALFASRRLALAQPVIRLVDRLRRAMGGWLRTRSYLALAVLGGLTGLLPCGLVYVACAGATATGGLITAVEYMAAFGLGTVPMLLAISLSGKLIQVSIRRWLLRLVPFSVAIVAVLLILRGMALGIPYLSPNLTASGGGSCCHGTPAMHAD